MESVCGRAEGHNQPTGPKGSSQLPEQRVLWRETMPTHDDRTHRVAAGETDWDQDFVTRLARALHELYRRERAEAGDAAARRWDELPTAFQSSSLDHARHVQVKLAVLGCRAVRDPSPDARAFEFTDEEVAHLARMEHDRWVEERRRGGWTIGQRDPERLMTPFLVSWEDLSEEMREVDRLFVRAIPEALAKLGFSIVRG